MTYAINIRKVIPLPVEETFAILSDHNRLGPILGLPVKRVREGEGSVNGLGSVRKMAFWPIDFDETVTAIEPNALIEYKITRGSPLKNHRGTVAFSAQGDQATEVIWDIEYDMGVPVLGSVIKRVLTIAIGKGLGKIGR